MTELGRDDDVLSWTARGIAQTDGWQTGKLLADPDWDPGSHRWLRLAESRETDRPAEALAVYWRVVDDVLQETDRRAYAAAVRLLKRARGAAEAAGELDAFMHDVALQRERHRRRPTLIAMLDKAGLR